RLRRLVALKVVDPGHGIDITRLDRFRREAEITSKLNNPGICPVYETGEDGGVLWIAMGYVEGDPLSLKIAAARDQPARASSVVEIPESNDALTSGASIREGASSPADGDTPYGARAAESSSGPRTWKEIARVLTFFEDAARILHMAHEHGVIHRDMKP